MGDQKTRTCGKQGSEIMLSFDFKPVARLEPENFGKGPEEDRADDLHNHSGLGLGIFEDCVQGHREEPKVPQKVLKTNNRGKKSVNVPEQ